MNIPTIEELKQIAYKAAGWGDSQSVTKDQRIYLTAIRDAVVAACRPQLRPIAEMPAEVPEGCVRVTCYMQGGAWYCGNLKAVNDTHFIDIALPVPTYPADFEAAWEQHGKPEPKSAAFALWKGGTQ